MLTAQRAPPEISGLTVVHKVGHLHKCLLAQVSDSNGTLCQGRKKEKMNGSVAPEQSDLQVNSSPQGYLADWQSWEAVCTSP